MPAMMTQSDRVGHRDGPVLLLVVGFLHFIIHGHTSQWSTPVPVPLLVVLHGPGSNKVLAFGCILMWHSIGNRWLLDR